jgi:hypothetical protein
VSQVPEGYVTAWSMDDRLFHLLMFAAGTGWLTDGEIAYVERALDEEYQRRQRLIDMLLAGIEAPVPKDLTAIENVYRDGRADGFAQGVAFAGRQQAAELGGAA